MSCERVFNARGSFFRSFFKIRLLLTVTLSRLIRASLLATAFEKLCWGHATDFARSIIHRALDYLEADSILHVFIIADVVILAKCIGEKKTGTVLDKFSIENISSGRSVVKKIRSTVAPLIKWMSNFDQKELCEFIQVPMLTMKPLPTPMLIKLTTSATAIQIHQKSLTPFTLEAAKTLVAPLSRQINIIPDDGSCFWISHTKDPKSAVAGRLADQYRSEVRDQVLDYLKDSKVLDESKENILIGIMDSLNEHWRTERHNLPPLTDHAEVSKEWSLRILDSDFYPGQIEGQILAGIQARKNEERTTHVARWNDTTAKIDVTQCTIDKNGIPVPGSERTIDISEVDRSVGVISLHDGG